MRTTVGFSAFCLLASSNYIVNDILDIASDRKHPFKRERPLARGDVSIRAAYIVSLVYALIGLGASVLLGRWFFIIAFVFLLAHYLNTFIFRRMSVIDIIVIALFYVLRVYAGQAATGYSLSIWLALSILSFSLLLAVGKRRAELTLITKTKKATENMVYQYLQYSEKLLDAYTAMFASATFIAYAFFTFLTSPARKGVFFSGVDRFTFRLPARKWMMATIPFVLYGILRYVQIIYSQRSNTLAKELVSDKRLVVSVILWGISVLIVVYGFGI